MANSPAAPIPRMNLTVAASGVFQFTVEGYSFTREDAKGDHEYYQSETFHVGGYEWAIRYFPKGGADKYRVVLALLSHAIQGLGVRFSVTLLSKSGVPSKETKGVTATNVPYDYLRRAREVLSFLIPHASTEEFVEEDSFVLHCTVSVPKKPASAPF